MVVVVVVVVMMMRRMVMMMMLIKIGPVSYPLKGWLSQKGRLYWRRALLERARRHHEQWSLWLTFCKDMVKFVPVEYLLSKVPRMRRVSDCGFQIWEHLYSLYWLNILNLKI